MIYFFLKKYSCLICNAHSMYRVILRVAGYVMFGENPFVLQKDS